MNQKLGISGLDGSYQIIQRNQNGCDKTADSDAQKYNHSRLNKSDDIFKHTIHFSAIKSSNASEDKIKPPRCLAYMDHLCYQRRNLMCPFKRRRNCAATLYGLNGALNSFLIYD